jgi:hypothetical protein
VDVIRIPSSELWKPDIKLYNELVKNIAENSHLIKPIDVDSSSGSICCIYICRPCYDYLFLFHKYCRADTVCILDSMKINKNVLFYNTERRHMIERLFPPVMHEDKIICRLK